MGSTASDRKSNTQIGSLFANVPNGDLGPMNHIPTTRLKNLYRDGVVVNVKEADHLRSCEVCTVLLRKFAEQRGKSIESKDKNDFEDRLRKPA